MENEFSPLYLRIKSELLSRIMSGELKKGDRLPSEREIAEEFKVSRVTVVGALKMLVEAGLIAKIRGSGSYVTADALDEDYDDIFARFSTKTETTISFGCLKPSPQHELLLKTFAGLFQIENPTVKVRIVPIDFPANDNADAFLIRLAGGNAPTVGEFFLHADYAAINGLLPLENLPGFEELSASLHKQCVYPTQNASGENHIHAISSRSDCRVVMVNATLLKKAGIDCDIPFLDHDILLEWITRMGRFSKQKSGFHGVSCEIPFGWHGVIGNFPYLWDQTPATFANTLDSFNHIRESQTFEIGIKFLSRVMKTGAPSPANGLDLFSCGRVGIILSSGTWPLVLRDLMADKFDMRAFPIPKLDSNEAASTVIGSRCLAIFRSAVKSEKEMEAAWKWIKFLFRKRQQYAQNLDFTFPALKDIPSNLEKCHPQIGSVFRHALQTGVPQFDFKDIRHNLSLLGEEIRANN